MYNPHLGLGRPTYLQTLIFLSLAFAIEKTVELDSLRGPQELHLETSSRGCEPRAADSSAQFQEEAKISWPLLHYEANRHDSGFEAELLELEP